MNELIFLVEESIEGGYTARALEHSIFTESESFEGIRAAVTDAVECHFEGSPLTLISLFTVRRKSAGF